jgi:hypothetical protein
MELETHAEIVDGVVKGTHALRLFEEGHNFSNSRGDGLLKQYANLGADSAALIIEVSDKNYFQLYYIEAEDVLVGNYYETIGPGLYQRRGRVRLQR